MTNFTCELTKPSRTMTLHNGSKQVGLLDFNGPVMTFEGDADESAKVFFDYVAERFDMSKKREWVGLTDEEAAQLWDSTDNRDSWELIKRVEAALKEKNT